MATVTLAFTSNADGTMSVTSSDTAGIKLTVDAPIASRKDYNPTWKRLVLDFVIGTLYP